MPDTPFDPAALARNRQRADRGKAPDLFLHARAADQIKERLASVNRGFTRPAIVTGWPDFWANAFPEATLVRDQDTLDLAPASHDLIIHALALHWSNDPVGQLIQCRRALVANGLFLGVLFGGQTLWELRSALAKAESRVKGGLSARVAPMADIRDLGGFLMRAGFALPVADNDPVSVSYASLTALMRDLRAMGETSAIAARPRSFSPSRVFSTAQDIYARHFSDAKGRLNATFDMICLTGWSPSGDQPRPLRPGSAAMSLAQALETAQKDGQV